MQTKEQKREYYERNKERILEKNRRYRQSNPDKMKAHYRKNYLNQKFRSYGITSEDYEQMLVKQEGKCAICSCDEPTQSGWHIDHDHVTNQVRGILCQKCNTALGLFQDNPSILKAAINYLNKVST